MSQILATNVMVISVILWTENNFKWDFENTSTYHTAKTSIFENVQTK